MSPGPPSRLPVILWLQLVTLNKAAQFFSYCAVSSPLPVTVMLPYYSFHDPSFTQNF
jgi:hypothetical protein